MYDELEESSFDNFDPDNFDTDTMNSYDPDNATGPKRAPRPKAKTQINISITNAAATVLNVELFSALDSITTRQKPEFSGYAPYTNIPENSREGIAAAGVGVVGFDKLGNLVMRGGGADPKLTVTCNEYPYVSLFESSKVRGFRVAKMRYTVSTDLQIDNNITHFTKTFGGGVKENTISPRAYFRPNQFQGKTIDIDVPFMITGESGLAIPVNAGETVRIALFIER